MQDSHSTRIALISASWCIGQEESIDSCKMTNEVHEKGSRNKPLSQEQKASNRQKSKSRVRVEHVFGS